MKKLLFTLLGVVFVASSASAMLIQLDTGTATTGLFDEMGISVSTRSTPTGIGTEFVDVGNLLVTSLLKDGIAYGSSNLAGLNDTWWLTGKWDDLQGYVSGVDVVYTSGTLDLYVANAAPVPGIGDTGTGYNTGTHLATLSLQSGGSLPNNQIGLFWKFEEILIADFWQDQNGNDLDPVLLDPAYLQAFALVTSFDIVYNNPVFDGQGNMIGFSSIDAKHHGHVDFNVVPEPATMALFGTGLLGLAGAGFRKKKQA